MNHHSALLCELFCVESMCYLKSTQLELGGENSMFPISLSWIDVYRSILKKEKDNNVLNSLHGQF
jgi:hypothetical protein